MPLVQLEAKVKNVRHKLIEPKDGGAYVATEVTLIVENELSPTELAELYRLQSGRAAQVTIEREAPQAELPLTGKADDAPEEGDVVHEHDDPEGGDQGQDLEDEHGADAR